MSRLYSLKFQPYNIIKKYLVFRAFILIMVCLFYTQSATSDSSKRFAVEITTNLGDKQEYIEGDDISFLVSISHDAYLLIVYQDAEKRLWQLLPNDFNSQSRFNAGIYIPIPNSQQSYRFRASAPFGKESLTVFASNASFPILKSAYIQNSLPLLDKTLKDLKNFLRARKKKNSSTLTSSTLTITTKQKIDLLQ